MARFTAFVALAFSLCQVGVQAAPLSSRAGIGSFLQCNAARLKIVTNLASTSSAVQNLANAVGGDAATKQAVTGAQTGLKDAQTGIATIAKALISGQTPPAAARDQVGKGLNEAQTALSGIAAPNQAAAQRLTDAQNKLKQTISAGQQVVDMCGGGGAAGTSLSSVATASMTATRITTSASAAPTEAGNGGATTTPNNAEATNCPPVSVVTSIVTVTATGQATATSPAPSASGSAITVVSSTVVGSGTVATPSASQAAPSTVVVSSKPGPQATKPATTTPSATKPAATALGSSAATNANANGKAAGPAKDSEFQTPGIVPRRQVEVSAK